ncbi:hypothetical protein KQI89_15755 [Clostridium sp. MSJ-4]|uniref:Uncharacterized protein n=1 Tax=Clostridium simiarum TaxID=2841506 RepID=A0ABS6F3W7_9CLOT|nr:MULTISPECIES: hypothetical protein [Clostridium]MBU5593204.1 hypothetical protein [Clostridium simiarum]
MLKRLGNIIDRLFEAREEDLIAIENLTKIDGTYERMVSEMELSMQNSLAFQELNSVAW